MSVINVITLLGLFFCLFVCFLRIMHARTLKMLNKRKSPSVNISFYSFSVGFSPVEAVFSVFVRGLGHWRRSSQDALKTTEKCLNQVLILVGPEGRALPHHCTTPGHKMTLS